MSNLVGVSIAVVLAAGLLWWFFIRRHESEDIDEYELDGMLPAKSPKKLTWVGPDWVGRPKSVVRNLNNTYDISLDKDLWVKNIRIPEDIRYDSLAAILGRGVVLCCVRKSGKKISFSEWLRESFIVDRQYNVIRELKATNAELRTRNLKLAEELQEMLVEMSKFQEVFKKPVMEGATEGSPIQFDEFTDRSSMPPK